MAISWVFETATGAVHSWMTARQWVVGMIGQRFDDAACVDTPTTENIGIPMKEKFSGMHFNSDRRLRWINAAIEDFRRNEKMNKSHLMYCVGRSVRCGMQIATVLLAILAVVPILLPAEASAGDAEDCRNAEALVKTDPSRAVTACRRLAEKGDAFSQNAIGTMYSLGRGVPLDYLEAVKWFQLAADQGLPGAQNNLGVMYSHGLGVPQDYVLAHLWLSLAAVSLAPGEGRDLAIKNRDRIEKLMTQEQLQEARRLAAEWKPQSSQ